VTDVASPRWEWRAFAPSFEILDPMMPHEFETAHEIYILSGVSSTSVKIRDGGIDVNTLESVRDGLELWRHSHRAMFPLCHREVRAVLSCLGVPRPQTLFLPCYSAADFLTDVACCTDDVHVIGVHKIRRHAVVDGCIVQRASISVAGRVAQTAAIESADAAVLRRQLHRLQFERFENVNYVDFLKRSIGVTAAGGVACVPALLPLRSC
jgi:hypothetical protein